MDKIYGRGERAGKLGNCNLISPRPGSDTVLHMNRIEFNELNIP